MTDFLLGASLLIGVIGGVVSLPILLSQLDSDAVTREVYWDTGKFIVYPTLMSWVYIVFWVTFIGKS